MSNITDAKPQRHLTPHEIPHETPEPETPPLPQTPLSAVIERLLVRIGAAISWIWVLLLLVIVANVTLRYLFAEGRIEFEELQWHLYSIGFLLGLSYCYASDQHVRVDVLHERFSPRLRAWVEWYGILFLLLPFCTLMLIYAVPFVIDSFLTGEVSQAPGGLSHRWLIKAVLPLGFALLSLAAIARLLRVWSALSRSDNAAATRGGEPS